MQPRERVPCCKGSTQSRTEEIEAAGRSKSTSKDALAYTSCGDLQAETALVGCAMEARPFAPALVTLEHQLLCVCHFRKRYTTAKVLQSRVSSSHCLCEALCRRRELLHLRRLNTHALHTAQSRRNGRLPPRVRGARRSCWSNRFSRSLRCKAADLIDNVREIEATGPRSSTTANAQHTTARSRFTLLSARPRPPR